MGDAKIKAVWKRNKLKKIDPELIDQSVHRILKSFIQVGSFDDKKSGNIESIVTSEEHKTIAREIAEESAILLKNDGALPLSKDKQNFLILGQDD